MLCVSYLFSLRYTNKIIILICIYLDYLDYLYKNFASTPNLQIVIYIILSQLKNGKSPIIEVLLTTFHGQGKKLLGFWAFFVALQWVL